MAVTSEIAAATASTSSAGRADRPAALIRLNLIVL
jgi:hypothetical protein